MEFKDRLKELREERNLTQSQLVKELNAFSSELQVRNQSISYWENGREPEFRILKVLASYFEVSVDYLIGNSSIRNMQVNSIFTIDEIEMLKKTIGEDWINTLINQFDLEKKVFLQHLTSEFANPAIVESLFITLGKVYMFYDSLRCDSVEVIYRNMPQIIENKDPDKIHQFMDRLKMLLSSKPFNILNAAIDDIDSELRNIKDTYISDLIKIVVECFELSQN